MIQNKCISIPRQFSVFLKFITESQKRILYCKKRKKTLRYSYEDNAFIICFNVFVIFHFSVKIKNQNNEGNKNSRQNLEQI